MSDRIDSMFFRVPPHELCWLASTVMMPLWLTAAVIGIVVHAIAYSVKEGFLWGCEFSGNLLRSW